MEHFLGFKSKSTSPGITTLLVVGFMGVFMLILSALTGYAFEQSKYGRALFSREQGIHIAEAGLEYYKWFLAHHPSALSTGSGIVSPYTYTVSDPEGGQVGSATVTATPNVQCGAVQWIDVKSKGTSNADSLYSRTLTARYMRPSVTQYSNIINSNVYAGAGRQIYGPYFSNGGIHMDSTNNSTVSSAVSSWSCTSTFGCSSTQTQSGVFGSGSGSALWKYPVSSIDFPGMALNFSTLAGYAQSYGIYLSGTETDVAGARQGSTYSDVSGSDQRGYHIIFNSSGTVTVYRVTGTSYTSGLHIDDLTYHNDYYTITSESLLGTYTPPSTCSIIFSKARTWVEGTVSGKKTLIAADPGNYNPDIILQGNLGYASTDGSTGLTAIAETSILIPPGSPDVMSVRGVLVAQGGYFGRNHYSSNLRTSLTINGTIVSNQRVGTQWTSGGNPVSGYLSRYESYDRLQAFTPPPFTPAVSTDYGYSLWREQ